MTENIEKCLAENGYYISTTVGTSMKPMLRNRRDRILIRPLGAERLQKYDVPLYRLPNGKYVLHRILQVKDGYYIIRGDNTFQPEKIPDEWILGVLTEFWRAGKHYNTDRRSYRRYAAFWHAIYPLRAALNLCRRAASKVKHAIFK